MKYILIVFFVIYSYGIELKYKSFSADFNQSVKSDNKIILYEGNLKVKNNLIFWHYKKPIEKKIWITNKIFIYEPDLEQVTIYNKDNNLFKLLKNAKKIKKDLYVNKYENRNIYFIIKNKMITKIYYKDKIDNLVTLNFYNIKKEKLNNSTFKAKYPNYVDIINSQ